MNEIKVHPTRAFEMEPVWLMFRGKGITYPAIYEPRDQFGSGSLRYSIVADMARLHKADEDTDCFARQFMGPKGFITAKSGARPEVECYDVDRLVLELQRLDARNINRDKLFTKCALVSIAVSPIRYSIPTASAWAHRLPVAPDTKNEKFGYSLYLHKVRISLPHEEVK